MTEAMPMPVEVKVLALAGLLQVVQYVLMAVPANIQLGSDGAVKLWNAATGNLIHTSNGNEQVDQLLVSPDGALIATGATEAPGGRHAEIVALDDAGDEPGLLVKEVVENSPADAAGLVRGDILLAEARYEEALDLFARAQDILGRLPGDHSARDVTLAINFGNTHQDLGNLREAARIFEEALPLSEDDNAPPRGRAECAERWVSAHRIRGSRSDPQREAPRSSRSGARPRRPRPAQSPCTTRPPP